MKKTFIRFACQRSPAFVLAIFLLLFLQSCDAEKKEKTFTIGFSQCQGSDEWRETMLAEMRRELSFHSNIKFIYKDAEGDSKKQLEQINELAKMHIDLLIVC